MRLALFEWSARNATAMWLVFGVAFALLLRATRLLTVHYRGAKVCGSEVLLERGAQMRAAPEPATC
jgi:hypothetical protein